MLYVAEIESNCGVSEPFQLGSEDHIKGAILALVLPSRSQRKLGLSSRPERRCACGLIKPRRQTIRKRCRQTDAPTKTITRARPNKHHMGSAAIPTRGEHKRRDRKERVDEKSGIEVRDRDRQIDQATNQSLERGNRQQYAPQPDARCG